MDEEGCRVLEVMKALEVGGVSERRKGKGSAAEFSVVTLLLGPGVKVLPFETL